jgi:hypothetical protein
MGPGRRSRLFGEVNDRIYDLLESADPDLPGEFHCECGRDCGRRVVLSAAAFVTLRREGRIVRSPDCGEPGRGRRDRGARRAGGVPVPS